MSIPAPNVAWERVTDLQGEPFCDSLLRKKPEIKDLLSVRQEYWRFKSRMSFQCLELGDLQPVGWLKDVQSSQEV